MEFIAMQIILMVIGGAYQFLHFPIMERCPFTDSNTREKVLMVACLWPALVPVFAVFAVFAFVEKALGRTRTPRQ